MGFDKQDCSEKGDFVLFFEEKKKNMDEKRQSRTVYIEHRGDFGKVMKEEKRESRDIPLITPEAERLFKGYHKILFEKKVGSEETKIKVGSLLSTLAFYYERFRNTIDYKQDQTVFRSSIERVSKRLLWENPSRAIDTNSLAESLIKELIWAKYIKNDTLPEVSILKIAFIFSKYLKLLSLTPENQKLIKDGIFWRDWVFGVCAGEIEEVIKPELSRYDILTNEVTNWFIRRNDWIDRNLSEQLKKVYLWAAAFRALFKSDPSSLRFHLLKRFLPSWFEINLSEIESKKEILLAFAKMIETCLFSKEHEKLYRLLQLHTPSFLVLSEIAEEEGAIKLITNYELLGKQIGNICEKKYSEIAGRVARGITRSVIYIFVSKMIIALLLEIPYEIFILKGLRYVPILINITLPPLMMFLVGLMIKRPNQENTNKIWQKIFDFVYGGNNQRFSFSLVKRQKSGVIRHAFGVFYAVFFVVMFSLISIGLFKLKFSVISALVFYMFLSLVLLFGFRVKHSASELSVGGDGESFLGNLISTLSLPFLNMGAFLSRQLSKLNFLVVFLDFLIEAPFKNILAVLEDWNLFMKEKKEEIINVPI